jgi:deleted-in-malignant-brain-tumors protein 1
VEVCRYNLWGLVSDAGWTQGDALVVCNQLGYAGGIAMPVAGSKYGKPNKTIHYRDVTCFGSEKNLAECTKTTLSLYSGRLAVSSTSVAGVDCIYDVPTEPPCVPKPAVTPGSCADGSVRLVTSTGSVSTETGRAEYCYNSNWTPFCKMDSKVASVICRQFGHTQYSCKTNVITIVIMIDEL